MAGTYSQLLVHVVFSVKNREKLIDGSWETDLHKYMTGIIQGKGQKLLAINGTRDHVHLLLGMKPDCSLSELIRELKKSSNNYIMDMGFTTRPFYWQKGFGAFSVSKRGMDAVIKYIHNQKVHHKEQVFRDEFLGFLNEHAIDYKEKYVF